MPRSLARGLAAGTWSLMLLLAVAMGASALMVPIQAQPRFETFETVLFAALLLVCAAGSMALLPLARARRRGPVTRGIKLARAGSWVLAVAVVDLGLILCIGAGLRVWSIAAAFGGIALLVAGAPRPPEFDLFDRR